MTDKEFNDALHSIACEMYKSDGINDTTTTTTTGKIDGFIDGAKFVMECLAWENDDFWINKYVSDLIESAQKLRTHFSPDGETSPVIDENF